jgi:uncharacterized protein YcbK (DUF882 family)
MVSTFAKGIPVRVSENFLSTEFDCKCDRDGCKTTLIDDALPIALESLRRLTGGPISLDCGYRCPEHNADVEMAAMGHVLEKGWHPLGHAADITTPKTPAETAALASTGPFSNGGVGTYKTFTHVDTRGKTARWQG